LTFLGWRIMTWLIWGWTALCALWVIVGIADRASEDCPPGDQLCVDASDAGTGIGVALIIMLWFMGFLVLSLIWFMTRPRSRECPACGSDVRRGLTSCSECGFNFAAPLRAAAVGSVTNKGHYRLHGTQPTRQPDQRFCTSCGNQLSTGARFCDTCGAQV